MVEGKFYIGMVKFFDVRKDFGYIASNNCNMDTSVYNQDFYVNSDSFAEIEARREERVVVFQIERQNWRERAINVRRITKSDEDINLVLSYYGDHEMIELRNNRKINLYRQIWKPRRLVAERVQSIIAKDSRRSPKRTAQHFCFFVEHYEEDNNSNDRYVFDRDFFRSEKTIWASLFSIMTDNELVEILKNYPSVCRYIDKASIIHEWIKILFTEKLTLTKLQDIRNNIEYLPNEFELLIKEKIESIVDARIKKIYKDLSRRSDVNEKDLSLTPLFSLDIEKRKYIEDLRSYLHLTTRNYEEEKKQCIAEFRKTQFKKELANFCSQPSSSHIQNSFFSLLDNLSADELCLYRDVIKEKITPILDNYIAEKSYIEAISLLEKTSMLGEDYILKYRGIIMPLIIDYYIEYLNSSNPNRNESDFLLYFEKLTSIFNNEETEQIIKALLPRIYQSQSLSLLSSISVGSHRWISLDEALFYAKQIISSWSFESINKFIKADCQLFGNKIGFAAIIIERAIQLIGNVPLLCFFDDTSIKNFEEKQLYSRYPEEENCIFLKRLKALIPNGQNLPIWDDYINSKSLDELLILFENRVINSMPKHAIEGIINAISLTSVDDNNGRWYKKPELSSVICSKILETTTIDLFPLIYKRLKMLDLSKENIPLAVLLAELISCNKPNSGDFNANRNWELNFRSQLENVSRISNNDKRISTILWTVYFLPSIPMTDLTEIFTYLPPYIQIKCVKKLFQLNAQGKFPFTAESLYRLITKNEKPICLPLEITFAYLKLREKSPSAKLIDKIMVQLLNGRDDHAEWYEISQLVTKCDGRWAIRTRYEQHSNWNRTRYYNGMLSNINGKLKLFVPYKMVDENGIHRDYNNKYFKDFIELIKITYSDADYQIFKDFQDISFFFDELYAPELFAITRSYNFRYVGFDNCLVFERKEDKEHDICECRLANKNDSRTGMAFYWCRNKSCFRMPIRYMLEREWEKYTILDFMRILGIPVDSDSDKGKRIQYGHYIILSSYLDSFKKFYEHLKCRRCGKLMRPVNIGNFGSRAVTEFSCYHETCSERGKIVYLNHCFNKQNCNATIDSRDSRTCPNGQYICPECGACCSTENYRIRISNLKKNGGYISDWLVNFVQKDLGHWEKHEHYCYKCGKLMTIQNGQYRCDNCDN